LASVGTIIDDKRRIDASTICFPIIDLFINDVVYSTIAAPV